MVERAEGGEFRKSKRGGGSYAAVVERVEIALMVKGAGGGKGTRKKHYLFST